MEPCDFFTLDVADKIGKAANPEDVAAFVQAGTRSLWAR